MLSCGTAEFDSHCPESIQHIMDTLGTCFHMGPTQFHCQQGSFVTLSFRKAKFLRDSNHVSLGSMDIVCSSFQPWSKSRPASFRDFWLGCLGLLSTKFSNHTLGPLHCYSLLCKTLIHLNVSICINYSGSRAAVLLLH